MKYATISDGEADTMKAVIFDRYGGPEVLQVTEVPIPEIKPGQVLVKKSCQFAEFGRLPTDVSHTVSGAVLFRVVAAQ